MDNIKTYTKINNFYTIKIKSFTKKIKKNQCFNLFSENFLLIGEITYLFGEIFIYFRWKIIIIYGEIFLLILVHVLIWSA